MVVEIAKYALVVTNKKESKKSLKLINMKPQ